MRSGLCLDAGALIALERGDPRVRAMLRRVLEAERTVHVPTGVVAQVWRGGGRQARLAKFLAAPDVTCVALDSLTARAVGELCARTGASDVVDGHVAWHARRHGLAVVTSDPDDITAFEAGVDVIVV